MKIIIDISSDFSFSYGRDNILFKAKEKNLSLTQGNIYGIYGENGSGKTTFLNILNTQLKPTTGSVSYNFEKHNYIHCSSSNLLHSDLISNNIRRCFQVPFLIDELSIYENILLSKRCYNDEVYMTTFKKHHDIVDERILKLLSIVNFSGQEKVKTLSYGQRRMVANLQMLYCEAPLTILDEPFANLHYDIIEKLKIEYENIVKRTNSTIVIVEHDRHNIECFVDKIITIKNKELYFSN